MSKHGQSTGSHARHELKEKLSRWLSEGGYSTYDVTLANLSWCLRADDGAGRVIFVGQRPEMPNLVVLGASLIFDEDHRKLFRAMPRDEFAEFLWNLRLELLKLGVGFAGARDPLEEIMFDDRIYRDALTQDAFYERCQRLRNATIMAIWLVRRRFREPPAEETPGLFSIN